VFCVDRFVTWEEVTMFLNQSNDCRQARRPVIRPRRIRPCLEALEDRSLPASYLWTGGGNPNLNWSEPSNWFADGKIAKAQPGPNDDLTFDGTGVAGTLYDSVVDPGSGGIVRSITVLGTYTNKTITLNRSLELRGGNSTIAAGAKIAGSGELAVTAAFPQVGPPTPSILAWTGGTLGGGGMVRVNGW
jgi:hypothetical protein